MSTSFHKSALIFFAPLLLCFAYTNSPAHNDYDDTQLLTRVSRAYAALASKTKPAVVFIKVEKTINVSSSRNSQSYNDPFGYFGDEFFRRFFEIPENHQRTPRHLEGQGSGFLISRNGYILTNNHVVGDADKITVKTSDGREHEAQRIGTDPESEVAVIKIEGEDFPYLEAGNSTELAVGEFVVAIGNPFGLNETVTFGHVSAKGRDRVGIANYENFIQTDASINPGNSGGPLLNVKGEVIGINTAIYSNTGGNLGIGFAIPINMAMAIKDQLITSGEVVRGYLGIIIREVTPELASHFKLSKVEGILIDDVQEGSAAEKAGLKAGDVVLELNGEKVSGVGKFRNEVASHTPGNELALLLIRGGKKKTILAKTGKAQNHKLALLNTLGLNLNDWDSDIANHFSYSRGEGVFVLGIESRSPAAKAGLRKGDLIIAIYDVQISTVEEFLNLLSEAKEKNHEAVLLRVRRGRYSHFVSLNLK